MKRSPWTQTLAAVAATLVLLSTVVWGVARAEQAQAEERTTMDLMDRDYGPFELPSEDGPQGRLVKSWDACGDGDEQGMARSVLRYHVRPGRWGESYVPVEAWKCFRALLHLAGVEEFWPERVYRETAEPVGPDWFSEPLGWYRWEVQHVAYNVLWQNPADCALTIHGLQGPPKAGTPWYFEGAPSFATRCPGEVGS